MICPASVPVHKDESPALYPSQQSLLLANLSSERTLSNKLPPSYLCSKISKTVGQKLQKYSFESETKTFIVTNSILFSSYVLYIYICIGDYGWPYLEHLFLSTPPYIFLILPPSINTLPSSLHLPNPPSISLISLLIVPLPPTCNSSLPSLHLAPPFSSSILILLPPSYTFLLNPSAPSSSVLHLPSHFFILFHRLLPLSSSIPPLPFFSSFLHPLSFLLAPSPSSSPLLPLPAPSPSFFCKLHPPLIPSLSLHLFPFLGSLI